MKLIPFLIFLLTTSLSIKANELKLIGTGLAEFSIFKIDIYQVSYFKGSNGVEELHLDYKRDISKKYSILGWEKGLEPIKSRVPNFKEKYQWIIDQVVDLKKGDIYKIRKEYNQVSMYKNSKLIGKITDPIIASIVFEPWIGKVPVDKDLKKKLLIKN
ncbi:MAG: hypothetical protein ACJAS4_001228 [Bacteriovoracaceae bacterium]|jgi:hypothetical protein